MDKPIISVRSVVVFCFFCSVVSMLFGCHRSTRDIEPVRPFDVSRYTGRWYEIARITHSFEKGLSGVTADYELMENDVVKVINRGFQAGSGRWTSAVGNGRFARSADTGWLKVSFFWIFYGDYKIFLLDPDYRWAAVTSGHRGYLWILSRQPVLNEEVKTEILEHAAKLDFDISLLEWVDQSMYVSKNQQR